MSAQESVEGVGVAVDGAEHVSDPPHDFLDQRVKMLERALDMVGVLVAEIPCQQMMTIEDCDVAVARHVRHPERYEKLPEKEWCERCKAVAILSRAALAQGAGK